MKCECANLVLIAVATVLALLIAVLVYSFGKNGSEKFRSYKNNRLNSIVDVCYEKCPNDRNPDSACMKACIWDPSNILPPGPDRRPGYDRLKDVERPQYDDYSNNIEELI